MGAWIISRRKPWRKLWRKLYPAWVPTTQQWERYWSLQGTWAVCEVDYDVGTWLA